jgi:hypothetical protein
VKLHTPARGARIAHVETLVPTGDFVHVKFKSTPPGAQLVDLAKPAGASSDRTYTPADLELEVGKPQRFMLVMPERVPYVFPPFTPEKGKDGQELAGELTKGATLHVLGKAGAKVTVVGTPHCIALEAPADCTLAPGDYTVELVTPGAAKQAKTVKVGADDTTVEL